MNIRSCSETGRIAKALHYREELRDLVPTRSAPGRQTSLAYGELRLRKQQAILQRSLRPLKQPWDGLLPAIRLRLSSPPDSTRLLDEFMLIINMKRVTMPQLRNMEAHMRTWWVGIVVMWLSTAVSAQSPQPGKKLDLLAYIQAGYAGLKGDLTAAADAMPEGDYGFKPSSMQEVRTFGDTILHVATAHFSACARLRGVTPEPSQRVDASNKAAVLKALAESFAFCDLAFSSVTNASANEFVRQGPVEVPKSAALVGLLAHDAEMYGITTVYLRAKNIVPPSTARQKTNR
jgi:hypothetical protein